MALWLLPERLADLHARIHSKATRYEILGIAAIVRSLILDPMTIESVARRRGAMPAPVFRYTPYEVRQGRSPGGLHWHDSGEHTLIFATAHSEFTRPTVSADLRSFLKAPAAQLRNEPVSVKQFVVAYANVLGGVHLGRPRSPHEDLLRTMVASLEDHTIHWSHTLQYIGWVTYRALLPIADPNAPPATPKKEETPTQPEG